MAVLFRLLLIVLILCSSHRKGQAGTPHEIIQVRATATGAPYKMYGDFCTGEELKRRLSEFIKEFPNRFLEPPPLGGVGGLLVIAEENASLSSVIRLMEILKECHVAAYAISSSHREDPRIEARLTFDVRSAVVHVERVEIPPSPPPDQVSPQQRIRDIAEKMGGRPLK